LIQIFQTVREQKERLLEHRNAMLAEHLRLSQQLEVDEEHNEVEAPVAISETPMELAQQSSSPCDMTAAAVAKLCFTPPAAFLEQLNLGGGSPSFVGSSAFTSANSTKEVKRTAPTSINLYMDGLLPALPLLYPYTSQIQTGLSC
jgi:hypothetical protein